MKKIQYRSFSLSTHNKNLRLNRPSVCHFELTFRCVIHCRHCYTDCYNKPAYIKKELNASQIKRILDMVYGSGAIWLCFSGGDPLARKDFPEVYSYAKKKGFIITVFTSGVTMDKKIINFFKKMPPFVIEMTLNSVNEKTYEKISQVRGSFRKAMRAIELALSASLPLKVKTHLTQDNFHEAPFIKRYIRSRGLDFTAASDILPRLNGDLTPCQLRISPEELSKQSGQMSLSGDECQGPAANSLKTGDGNLFTCAVAGGDGINIDPYGNLYLCNCIRKPKYSLLKNDIAYGRKRLLSWAREKRFNADSQCRDCRIKTFCRRCPGRALLETGNIGLPVEYYCQLARMAAGENRKES